MGDTDFFDDGIKFFLCRTVHLIVFIFTRNRTVGRNFDNAKTVDFHELVGFGHRRTRHATQFFIQAEVVLECHRRECHVLGLDRAVLFGFDRLVQTVRQTTTRHHTACEFVDQHNVAVTNDVVFVLGEQLVSTEALVHVVNNGGAFWIVERLVGRQDTCGPQTLFEEFVTLIGKGHLTGLFIDGVVRFSQLWDQRVDGFVQLRTVLRWTRNDQRGPRFVDKDGVDLVHNREVVLTLHHLAQL